MRTVYYFRADWCKPCERYSPRLWDHLHGRDDFEYRIIDVDDPANFELAARFNIMTIPTLVLTEDGFMLSKLEGVQPDEEITKWLRTY